jgi:hypothetical protein
VESMTRTPLARFTQFFTDFDFLGCEPLLPTQDRCPKAAFLHGFEGREGACSIPLAAKPHCSRTRFLAATNEAVGRSCRPRPCRAARFSRGHAPEPCPTAMFRWADTVFPSGFPLQECNPLVPGPACRSPKPTDWGIVGGCNSLYLPLPRNKVCLYALLIPTPFDRAAAAGEPTARGMPERCGRR